ncbi:MAG: PPC domain-containing protein [Planctomycetota bacterium]|nr:PPC domain-containing protein [Planctomycetota bacterium]
MAIILRSRFLVLPVALFLASTLPPGVSAAPAPVLNTVFPAGGQAGTTVEVTIAGGSLVEVSTLHCSLSGIECSKVEGKPNTFTLAIPKDAPVGQYDLYAVTRFGVSSPRVFVVGSRQEILESQPDKVEDVSQSVPLGVTINGQIQKGDVDQYSFSARKGQRVIVECLAERIDSNLRAMLGLYDSEGRRLAVNRGYFDLDPLIVFDCPRDGTYTVRVYDLVYSGSNDHFYRLDIDTGPRVVFTAPSVVEAGKKSQVTLFGWNLDETGQVAANAGAEPPHPDPLPLKGERGLLRADDVEGRKGKTPSLLPSGGEGGRRPDEGAVPAGQFAGFESRTVEINAPIPGGWGRAQASPQSGTQTGGSLRSTPATRQTGLRLRPGQVTSDCFAFRIPGGHAPVPISVTDVPVQLESKNNSPQSAQEIVIPGEVSGQLVAGDEKDWFTFTARRGEVLWLEAFGERIGSPVDLDLSVLDEAAEKELARFSDEVADLGGRSFPSSHSDPAGRFVAPADARYLVLVRSLTGGLDDDPRRVYRLSIRRQEPQLHLAVLPRSDTPAGINLDLRGRTLLDVLAFRGRGLTGSIRVSAKNLPPGIECPDVWLGPGINRAPLVLTATDGAKPTLGSLSFEAHAEGTPTTTARAGVVVRSPVPRGWSRITDSPVIAIAGESRVRLTADGHETRTHQLFGELKVRHSPGGILDVAVNVDRLDIDHQAPVKLIGVGVPDLIENQTAEMPAGQKKGYLSFYLPPTLAHGRYTIAVEGQTTVPVGSPDKSGKQKTEVVTIFSNPVTFDVSPPAFIVTVDPYNPKQIRRGEVLQVKYSAKRTNGFISKIHTELFSTTEKIDGLRGRGVTFVGQTDSGTIQIIANEDARLGKRPSLRLYAVGVLEDEAVYHGSCLLEMEVVE